MRTASPTCPSIRRPASTRDRSSVRWPCWRGSSARGRRARVVSSRSLRATLPPPWTGCAPRPGRPTSGPRARSPATRPTTTSGGHRAPQACGRAFATRSTSRRTATCCSWRASRSSGRTSARASGDRICSRPIRDRSTPTTPAATGRCKKNCATSSGAGPRPSGSCSAARSTPRSPRSTRRRPSPTIRSSSTVCRGCRPRITAPTCSRHRSRRSASSCLRRRRAPKVGEHTDEILREVLGYDDAHVDDLRAAGALG